MLYKETVEPGTLGLLRELMAVKELEQFRLIGGTALSLLLGHRASIDLDMCTDASFDADSLFYKLSSVFPSFSVQDVKSPRLFFTYINDVKVDFVHTFEPFAFDCDVIDGIRFGSVEEIIALKLNAIAGRGAKKDFWDLHELLSHYSLDQMMEFYQKRYPNKALVMVAKSLTYFVDADLQPDPKCFKNLKWGIIKENIKREINTYISK
jgi:predicted nucleotidyltransferase component of viral defense system